MVLETDQSGSLFIADKTLDIIEVLFNIIEQSANFLQVLSYNVMMKMSHI